jgi:hypothetical protein
MDEKRETIFDALVESIWVYKGNFDKLPGKVTLTHNTYRRIKLENGLGDFNAIMGIPVVIDDAISGSWVMDA